MCLYDHHPFCSVQSVPTFSTRSSLPKLVFPQSFPHEGFLGLLPISVSSVIRKAQKKPCYNIRFPPTKEEVNRNRGGASNSPAGGCFTPTQEKFLDRTPFSSSVSTRLQWHTSTPIKASQCCQCHPQNSPRFFCLSEGSPTPPLICLYITSLF